MPSRRESVSHLEQELLRAQNASTTSGSRSHAPTDLAGTVTSERSDDENTPEALLVTDLIHVPAVASEPRAAPIAPPAALAHPPEQVPRSDLRRAVERIRNLQKQQDDRALRTLRLLGLTIVQQEDDLKRVEALEAGRVEDLQKIEALETAAAQNDEAWARLTYALLGLLLAVTTATAFGVGIAVVWFLRWYGVLTW